MYKIEPRDTYTILLFIWIYIIHEQNENGLNLGKSHWKSCLLFLAPLVLLPHLHKA